MKSAVIVFPGSNCDRDAAVALERITGNAPHMVWHKDTDLPEVDLVVLPGGFSFGDYLRSGAMSASSPIMAAVKAHADAGRYLVGICNGFQVLTEAHLLPGALMRNAGLNFVCRTVPLIVANDETAFTRGYKKDSIIKVPVAHHDGNYFADDATLEMLEGEGRVVFRYGENPNGSLHDIAGIINKRGNVLGLMPHPERVVDPMLGGEDGVPFFSSVMEAV
ncbi:MAG: phosphoribosylformylglycinamidine synthase subunit PurQ [Alphaproteobacteria bacterium]|nr:MAG: phosphoribosylformylglycinamidine synthase subunit PurQ [Alphaproteobacteria bacterium]